MEEAKIIYLMNLPLTDAGNANSLHSLLGDDWKFVPQLGRWLHWNGQRWQEETDGSIRVAAMEAFRNLAADIRSLPSCHDMKEMQHRQKVADGLGRAESIGRIRGALSFLEGLALKQYGEFDTDPFLLNLQNGTLNLSTGELRPHNKKDFITKICGASYEPRSVMKLKQTADPQPVAEINSLTEQATSETVSSTGDTTAKESGMNVDIFSENNSATSLWEETVRAILPDPAVRRWLQKFMGYCLTGSTEEEKFVVAYGPGGCGKGTFFETVAAVMGDYKSVVPVDILLTSNVYNGVTYDTETTFNSFESCKLYEVTVTAKKPEPEISDPEKIAARMDFAGVKVLSHNGSIVIENAPIGSMFTVTDLNGRVLKASKTQSAMHEIRIGNRGVMLVKVGGNTYKVVK